MNTSFSTMSNDSLVLLISDFVQSTPAEIVTSVLDNIDVWKELPTDLVQIKLLSSVQNPQIRDKLNRLLECWTQKLPELKPQSIYLAIRSSLATMQASNYAMPELIWTGPENCSTSIRRTDQTLLELIQGSREQLLIVSFAVYKAKPIIDAIEEAILRNVNVIICLEDSAGNQGKISFSGLSAFSDNIFNLASFYTWPIENRPHTAEGKYGSLHAKLAVADQEKILITSANMTDFALDLNMEMGILINSKSIGCQISNLFRDLILNSIFTKI